MKKIIASLTLAFLFACGSAWAGSGESHDGEAGCHHNKWQDT